MHFKVSSSYLFLLLLLSLLLLGASISACPSSRSCGLYLPPACFPRRRWPVPAMRSVVKRAGPDAGAELTEPRSLPETHPPVNTSNSGVDTFIPAAGAALASVSLTPHHNVSVTSSPQMKLMNSDLRHMSKLPAAQQRGSGGVPLHEGATCSDELICITHISHTFRPTQ